MEEDAPISGNLILWSIVALTAGIRFYNSFHILLSDEAFNLISIETLSSGKGFSHYFYRHPPLYLLLSSGISYMTGPYPQVPSFLSIIFSVLSLVPLYLIAEHLMGRKVALWAAYFFAVMPAGIYYSTWIKQDAMLLFFFWMGIYFYLKERYLLSGITIGIALLVKEFAFFLFPLFFLLNLFCKQAKKSSMWRGLFIVICVSIVISSWWYVLFGSTFFTVTSDALIGGNIMEGFWHFPWRFYLKNMPHDFSYPIFIFFLIGLALLLKDLFRPGWRDGYFFIMVLIVFYVPLSLLVVKAPWYTYSAIPSAAVIAGFGVVRIAEVLESKFYTITFYLIVLLPSLFLLYSFDAESYYETVTGVKRPRTLAIEVQGETWIGMVERKEYWRSGIKGKVGFLEVIPSLQYVAGIGEDRVVFLSVSKFISRDRKKLMDIAKEKEIGTFILNTESLTYTEKNIEDMIALWGEPEKVGRFLIFKTDGNGGA